MAKNDTWMERTGVRLRGVVEFLRDNGRSAHRGEILDAVKTLLPPNEHELALRSGGQEVWENDLLWQTTSAVKAGWITKDGAGTWTITPAGIAALDEYPDGAEFLREAIRKFNVWKKEHDEKKLRRAWLIKGTSVRGVDLVPDWLEQGYCSVSASRLSEISAEISAVDLEAKVRDDFAHLPLSELKSQVDEIVPYVTRMSPGDVLVTTHNDLVYVGDVVGEWTYQLSEGNRSNLRRPVEWRNAESPLDRSELPPPLPARFVTGSTLLDLTSDLDLIDDLTTPIEVITVDPGGIGGRTRRHEHLKVPSDGLAEALFVDQAWLAEVRLLLDERRQLIFYGPPGTGKTWIAQKLAEDLVGAEQVKLVQFHPAYTYEDFFEGYRPAPGATGGSIGFELKPGPFRQLVNRALKHPDQAFVLIIDEINRANLAKVFGELYFLLEYRDQAVDLLYSEDEEGFTLPRNLYLIGTMNTADRSIALVDAAMRRRFAFVELSPDIEPSRSLLAKWSEHWGLGTTAADLLRRLNERIEDPDFRIGPSYFMGSKEPDAHTRERLERIWRTSILPLLQEHHYGEWSAVESRYRLDTLLGDPTPEPVPADE